MEASIAGLGWVTPLGTGLGEVWQSLARGDIGECKELPNPETGRAHRFMPVPLKLVEALCRHPRLRRSSPISLFAVTAGLAAIEDAGLKMTPEAAARTAVVFAISDGGVLYTRKFYEQVVKLGANAASPLLFPETVYNAPASHLAALLGVDGASYTLVGDASVGLAALHFAAQLLALGDLDQVIVVGAEECDWILCEAYADWRLDATPLAEGAAAVVLRREGRWKLQTHPGASFFRQREAPAAFEGVLVEFAKSGPFDLAVGSVNGTFVDRVEAGGLARYFPGVPALQPKRAFGEAPGASALLQVVTAAQALEARALRRALVPVIGLNQQAAAVALERV